MMTSSGCAHFATEPPSAEAQVAAVSPASECKRIAKPVSDPGYRTGQDAIAVIGRYQAQVLIANRRLDAVAKCADTVADRSAGGGQ